VTLVQIRERQLPDRALFDLTRAACDAARGTALRVVVNDRVDVALAAGAHGVHLRGSSFSAARVRAAAGEDFLIGRSIHDVDEAVEVAREGGCDYLMFGTVFPSSSKPAGHRAAGIDDLRAACAGVDLPVVAIGGITRANVPQIRAAGAGGVAAITLFDDVESIPAAIRAVRRAFDT
jgi:thiamine-phosphate diphosphorylase